MQQLRLRLVGDARTVRVGDHRLKAELPSPSIQPLITPVRLVLYPDTEIHHAVDQLLKKEAIAAPVVNPEGQLLGLLTEKDCLRMLTAGAYDDQFQSGTVHHFMSEARETIREDMNLGQATEVFLRCNFASLPVVNETRLTGRLARRDLMRAVNQYALELRQAQGETATPNRPKSIEEMQRQAGRQNPGSLGRVFSRRR